MKLLRTLVSFVRALWRIIRRYPKSSVATVLTFCLLYLGVWYLRQPAPPEYLTEPAFRGNLEQVVEAVGTVISERDLKLQFPITGIIDAVNVQEGDHVEEGQELARLRSSGLSADVKSAQAEVASASAELQKLLEGTRPEEIAVTEASVTNKRAALDAAKATLANAERQLTVSQEKLDRLHDEADVSLQGYVSTARSSVSQHLSTALTASRVMDDVLSDNNLLDAFLKFEAGKLELLNNQISSAQNLIQGDATASSSVRDYASAIEVLALARQHIADLANALNDGYTTISALPVTSYFSASDREDVKSDVALQRSNVQSALSSLDTALKNLRDAAAGYDTKIATEEANVVSAQGTRDRAVADIATYETSLRTEEAQLALLKAGTRKADIDSARARLNQAYASLQRAKERYDDTVILAPIGGVITKVNLKAGELLSTSFASDAAITMLGDAPYRVEMYVAEIDIPKVQMSQTGAIELDAFPGEEFLLSVTEVDPAATSVDGVSKYRVKLDFFEQREGLKIGMTGDAEIRTDSRTDVIIVPGRAVLTGDDGRDYVRILRNDGTIDERDVEVGIDGRGGEVEIIDGVEEGEQVIVLIKE